ncbi:HAD-IA family hydrolase [Arthrobacter yangruifuii]|uniref:HAD-IA family hydrolase n=2 Tax=Arthrobacter yangruifuii TaxID=2606616 RepID=A0A5N6MJA6_9MICC|nr:HAD-IA family hydrolase [Arthrobacter yangruifuii]
MSGSRASEVPLSSPGMWYLFDYGMVISTAPEPADWDALQAQAGRDLAHADSRYWTHREAFDAGTLTPADYWAAVLGRTVEEERLAVLEDLDAAQWSRLNPATVGVLQSLADEGARLALLSNMPEGMSERYLRESSWAQYFEKTYFSGPLRMTKPDRRIFEHVLRDLPAAPGDVVFIDDNTRNISAAQALGFRTVLFGAGTDLRRELADLRR